MFSRALTDVDLSKCKGINDTNIYFSIGSLEYNKDVDTWRQMMKEANIDYTYELYNAAHDWNMWRTSFTTFVKDVCWKENTINDVINEDTRVNEKNPVVSVKTGDDTLTSELLISIITSGYVMLKIIRKSNLSRKSYYN